jgi:hypothetical protein
MTHERMALPDEDIDPADILMTCPACARRFWQFLSTYRVDAQTVRLTFRCAPCQHVIEIPFDAPLLSREMSLPLNEGYAHPTSQRVV